METQNGTVKDLTSNRKVQTVGDMMVNVADVMLEIKSGVIDPKVGALMMRGFGLQFRGVELTLQAARLDQSMRKDLHKRIGSLPEAEVIDATVK